MTAISWGQGDRLLEYGVDHAVLYISGPGIPWDGISGIEEVPSDAAVASYYFDGVKTIDSVDDEDFGLHVAAYFCPEELDELQSTFGFSYRTKDISGIKLHLVWNATAVISSKSWTSKSGNVSPSDFAWDISTVPTKVPGAKPTAHLVVDVESANPDILTDLEDIIYGTDDTIPHLPTAEEIVDLFSGGATLVIVNHGDGTWTATGPDDVVYMLDSTTFEIDWPSVIYLTSDKYKVSSL